MRLLLLLLLSFEFISEFGTKNIASISELDIKENLNSIFPKTIDFCILTTAFYYYYYLLCILFDVDAVFSIVLMLLQLAAFLAGQKKNGKKVFY